MLTTAQAQPIIDEWLRDSGIALPDDVPERHPLRKWQRDFTAELARMAEDEIQLRYALAIAATQKPVRAFRKALKRHVATLRRCGVAR